MVTKITSASVLVICLLAGVSSVASSGNVEAGSSGLSRVDHDTPSAASLELQVQGNENGTGVRPSENATPGSPPTARTSSSSPNATANGPETMNGNNGSGGILSGIGRWFDGLRTALANPLNSFQDYARKVLLLLVDRPVPTRNTEPAWYWRPDGALMGAVYEVFMTTTLPVALLLSTLYAGLAVGMRGLVPSSVVPNRKATGAVWQSLGTVGHVLLGWPIMVGWAVLVHGLATWLAPAGRTVFPGGGSTIEHVVAGGFAGYLLWSSAGVLAVLVVLVWVISWIGALLAPPAYPLLVAAKPPDLPVLKNFRMLPDEGILFALVATPVPTAAILGLGYPAINAFQTTQNGQIATLGGVGLAPLLTLGMWFAALVAPLWMLISARQWRPVAMFAAGALGTASVLSVRNRLGSTSDASPSGIDIGARNETDSAPGMDPIYGSPFRRSPDGGDGSVGSTDSGVPALPTGTGGWPGSGGGTGVIPTPSPGTSGATSRGVEPVSGIRERSKTVDSIDEIPEGQRYEVGFETVDGNWQVIEDTTFSRMWLLDESAILDRVGGAYGGDRLYAKGVEDGVPYDVRKLTDNQ